MLKSYKKFVGAVLVASLTMFAMAGCSQSQPQQETETDVVVIDTTDTSGGVAATVNGVEIGENAVSAYIDNFRQTNDLTDDEAWGSYMGQNGYTPESLREIVVDNFVNEEIVRQAAKENGIEVTDEDVEAAFEQAKKSAGNESSWRIALKYSGMTEDQYKDSLRQQLLQRELFYKATGTSQLDSTVSQITSTLRQSGGEELANLIDRASAKMSESTDTQKVKADDELVLSLIKTYEQDYANAESLDGIPADVVVLYRTQADSVVQNQAFEDFMKKYTDAADVQKNGLPEGATYKVEVIVASPNETTEDQPAAAEGEQTDTASE
ncbi:SurA N-terminal domain-containing protein [Adlercreutzia sp. ZJ304]|uniref:SurA N-terminal domain-containing protein n=1 Tax=Adlercreutzia sp. ZJ304 TaxID=2709791 RepID=UPI0013EA5FA0|nr:SurA N-terminal domain-containing protein [Adlercreutzia sp. ZJ304]